MLDAIEGITLAGRARPMPIDIEFLVQWAVARSGRLPWDRTRDRELMFDQGLTAKPRHRMPSSWVLAEACAGLRHNSRALPAIMRPGPDAERVIEAIKRLNPSTAANILACARAKIRPDCMLGIEPRRVPRSYRGRKSHRRAIRMEWEPCTPEAICAARAIYMQWHVGMTALAECLRGGLEAWDINGFRAPAQPWEGGAQETA